MSKAAPLPGPLVTKTTVTCAVLVVIMAVLIGWRMIAGLGAVTNLSNGYGFGLWIAYDVVIGTAFACGGYSLALMVYIFNRGEYHALVRPALLASCFGYSLGGGSIVFDIGRYWNMWHIFIPGWANPDSIMFEVALCIACYCMVLWVEFLPVVAERFGTPKIRKFLNKIVFVFIAIGCLLPTMHQSSLGSLLIPTGYLLHPLWQTDLLPLLFLSSAICMGYSIVIFEGTLVHESLELGRETPLLAKLSRVIACLLAFYLVVRWGDIAVEGKLGLIFNSGRLTWFFLAENALFALPIFLIVNKKTRMDPQMLFIAAVSMLLAGSLYRLDAFLVAYGRTGWHYFPSVGETLITAGIIAAEVLGYILLVRFLPVITSHVHGHKSHAEPAASRAPSVAATTNE